MHHTLIDLLRCPDCLGNRFAKTEQGYLCEACGRTFMISDDVLDTRPVNGIRLPKMYEDPNLVKWHERWQEGHDYLYDSGGFVSWVQNAGHRAIAKFRANASGSVLLDLGCGDGAHLDYAGAVDTYVGLDADQTGLKRFAQRGMARPIKNLHAIKGDAYLLPFRDGVFDTVVSVYCLEHLCWLDLCLEEIVRVLEPTGLFCVSVPNEGGLAWSLARHVSSRRHFNDGDLDYDRVVMLEHVNCIWQVERTLKRHFKIVERDRFPLPLPTRHLNLVTSFACRKN